MEFVTDMRGEAYQFFLNTPWGENLENQFARNYTAFSSRFRFNPPPLLRFRAGGKEWEGQALRNRPVAYFSAGARLPRWRGNFYYGARYVVYPERSLGDPKISVWLSVDAMTSKYPSVTPYNFSLNNPLLFVDPDGNEVVIAGETRKEAYKQLRKALKREGITLTKQETANGFTLGYEIKDNKRQFSQGVDALLMAMDEGKISLTINASESAVIDYDRKAEAIILSNGGSFMGSKYSSANGGTVQTEQRVVPLMFVAMESVTGVDKGSFMLHEASEGAIASLLALNAGKSVNPGGGNNQVYQNADAAAYPQPFYNYYSNMMMGNGVTKSPGLADQVIWSILRPDPFGQLQPVNFWSEDLSNL